MSWRWSLYLNRCVAALALEALDAPGAKTLFTLETTLLEMEGRNYIIPIQSRSLSDILAGRRPSSIDSRGGIGTKGASVGAVRECVSYNAHLTALFLQDEENLRTLLAGTLLPTLQGHVICKNWHLYGL